MLTVTEVGPSRAENTDKVKTGMFEEALVLGREDGLNKHRGQVFITDRATLFPGAVKKICDELGLNFGRAQVRASAERADRANGLAVELDSERVRTTEIGKLGGPNVDNVAVDGVFAQRILIGLRAVTRTLQVRHEVLEAPSLPVGNMAGRGENLGGVLEDMA